MTLVRGILNHPADPPIRLSQPPLGFPAIDLQGSHNQGGLDPAVGGVEQLRGRLGREAGQNSIMEARKFASLNLVNNAPWLGEVEAEEDD